MCVGGKGMEEMEEWVEIECPSCQGKKGLPCIEGFAPCIVCEGHGTVIGKLIGPVTDL